MRNATSPPARWSPVAASRSTRSTSTRGAPSGGGPSRSSAKSRVRACVAHRPDRGRRPDRSTRSAGPRTHSGRPHPCVARPARRAASRPAPSRRRAGRPSREIGHAADEARRRRRSREHEPELRAAIAGHFDLLLARHSAPLDAHRPDAREEVGRAPPRRVEHDRGAVPEVAERLAFERRTVLHPEANRRADDRLPRRVDDRDVEPSTGHHVSLDGRRLAGRQSHRRVASERRVVEAARADLAAPDADARQHRQEELPRRQRQEPRDAIGSAVRTPGAPLVGRLQLAERIRHRIPGVVADRDFEARLGLEVQHEVACRQRQRHMESGASRCARHQQPLPRGHAAERERPVRPGNRRRQRRLSGSGRPAIDRVKRKRCRERRLHPTRKQDVGRTRLELDRQRRRLLAAPARRQPFRTMARRRHEQLDARATVGLPRETGQARMERDAAGDHHRVIGRAVAFRADLADGRDHAAVLSVDQEHAHHRERRPAAARNDVNHQPPTGDHELTRHGGRDAALRAPDITLIERDARPRQQRRIEPPGDFAGAGAPAIRRRGELRGGGDPAAPPLDDGEPVLRTRLEHRMVRHLEVGQHRVELVRRCIECSEAAQDAPAIHLRRHTCVANRPRPSANGSAPAAAARE